MRQVSGSYIIHTPWVVNFRFQHFYMELSIKFILDSSKDLMDDTKMFVNVKY